MSRIFQILIAVSALMFATACFGCGLSEKTADGYENATVAHAHDHWSQGETSPIPFIILDVRTPEEFAEGHIAGARLIPVQELENRLAEVPGDRQVYVYCRSGVRSARASKILATAGFTRVENIEGGIKAWQAAGFPVVQ